MRLFAIILLLASFNFMAHGESNEWELEKENKDLQLKIYTREVSGSNLKEFKGELIAETSLTALAALLLDSTAAPQWMHQCEKFEVIEQNDPQSAIVYFINSAPWPVTDRDAIVSTTMSQDPETLTVRVEVEALADRLPDNDDYVHISKMMGFWSFSLLTDGKVKVVYQVHAEPSGSLPSWLANSVVVDTPYYSLRNMLKMLKLEKYKQADISFIKNEH